MTDRNIVRWLNEAVVAVTVLQFGDQLVVCLLTRAKVAQILSVSPHTVDREVSAGRLAKVVVRGQVRYLLDDVLDYTKRQRVEGQ